MDQTITDKICEMTAMVMKNNERLKPNRYQYISVDDLSIVCAEIDRTGEKLKVIWLECATFGSRFFDKSLDRMYNLIKGVEA